MKKSAFISKGTFISQGTSPRNRPSKKPASSFIIYLVFTILVASNIAMGLALAMSPEISRLLQRSKDPVLLAYETRIMQLRMEVDRLNSRQYIQAGNLNLRLQELLRQQQVLGEQYRYIQVLAQRASELGGLPLASVSSTSPAGINGQNPENQEDTGRNANEFAPVATGGLFQRSSLQIPAGEQSPSGKVPPAIPGIRDAGILEESLNSMMDQSQFIATAIARDATSSTDKILQELQPLGIAPDMEEPAARTEFSGTGVGGPLIPLPVDENSRELIEQINNASSALDRLQQARTTLASAPIYYPLPQKGRISSPFGPRLDPFGKTRAFHSGIDYPSPRGTPVTSVGSGVVLFAGTRGGYGKFVEIDHGGGIITRYAHMSKILVQTGQQVKAGDNVGEVGSTGRSTGPHLHVEVRRDNVPINPLDFFTVEEKLQGFIR